MGRRARADLTDLARRALDPAGAVPEMMSVTARVRLPGCVGNRVARRLARPAVRGAHPAGPCRRRGGREARAVEGRGGADRCGRRPRVSGLREGVDIPQGLLGRPRARRPGPAPMTTLRSTSGAAPKSGASRLRGAAPARARPCSTSSPTSSARSIPTLAYRFACRVGMCGSCAMTVNGRARWTCRTHVDEVAEGGALEIAPLAQPAGGARPRHRHERRSSTSGRGAQGRFEPTATRRDDFARVAPDSPERRAADAAIECIGCGVCYASCDVVAWNPGLPRARGAQSRLDARQRRARRRARRAAARRWRATPAATPATPT